MELSKVRRTRHVENTNSIAIEAVKKTVCEIPFSIAEIDLIMGRHTLHMILLALWLMQYKRKFNIDNTKCFTIDSACSSFVNAIEIVDCFFANNKASKALIVISENNSLYNDDSIKNQDFCGEMVQQLLYLRNKGTQIRILKFLI